MADTGKHINDAYSLAMFQHIPNLVEWAIASHGMYKSALVIFSILKQKNLYIVGCVQCYIWDITAYFIPESKYHYEK
jgi:hypothetical protein